MTPTDVELQAVMTLLYPWSSSHWSLMSIEEQDTIRRVATAIATVRRHPDWPLPDALTGQDNR